MILSTHGPVKDDHVAKLKAELERLRDKYGTNVRLAVEYTDDNFDKALADAVRRFEIICG